MSIVIVTFDWSPDEGLVDVLDDNLLAVAFSADQGGSLEWQQTTAGVSANGERARKSATTDTWPDLFPGIPAGSTINTAKCNGVTEYYWNNGSAAAARRLQIRLVDDSAVNLLAGDLFDDTKTIAPEPIDGSGQPRVSGYGSTVALGTVRAVLSGSQAANSPVRLEIQDRWTGGGSSVAGDQEQKNIIIEVDFTGPPAGVVNPDYGNFPKPILRRVA